MSDYSITIKLTGEQAITLIQRGAITIEAAPSTVQAPVIAAEQPIGGVSRPLNIVPVDASGCELLPAGRRVQQSGKRYGYYSTLEEPIPAHFVVGCTPHNILMALAGSSIKACVTSKDMVRLCGKRYGTAMNRLRREGHVIAVKLP
jgi:hypothetical protein